jgi:exonuclease SbcC
LIIEHLDLENIRSYRHGAIDLPKGITLFEGDIGSGKSTILMAIEFALFGLGSQKGASLLKANEKKGSVSLDFSVDGDRYTIYRTLEKKKGGVQQGKEGYIVGPEGKMPLSATELKGKILEILGFNEPLNPNAESLIYRYAIFTPQEQMKEILARKPTERLQTLRKALHIEDYQLARDNADVLASYLKNKASNLKAFASDIETKRGELAHEEQRIQEEAETLKDKQVIEEELNRALQMINEQLGNLQVEREALIKIGATVPQLEEQLKGKQGEMRVAKDEHKQALEALSLLYQEMHGLKYDRPTDKSEQELADELNQLKSAHRDLEILAHNIDFKLGNYERIRDEKICPTCDRAADPAEFQEKITAETLRKQEMRAEILVSQGRIETIETSLSDLRSYNRSQELLAARQREASILEEKKAINEGKATELQETLSELNERLGQAQSEIASLKGISEKLAELENERRIKNSDLTDVGKNISSLERGLELRKQTKVRLDKEIKVKQDNLEKADLLDEHIIWIKNYFSPTLSNIEQHVLVTYQQEFNQLFQQWFGLLVEDPTKEARIDEDFTPIIEQDGYEHDVQYLSGGEKTSIALAYRLALNMIVRKESTSLKSNLLILDEPTDGFSREQLLKIRDILAELECPQVIIVSHEKELESFAHQIFRVLKYHGESVIEAA